jgi:AraC-like DNA-binding protein
MDDSLPSSRGWGRSGCDGDFPRSMIAWPSFAPVLTAVEKRDQHGYRLAVTQFGEGLARLAEASPTAGALFAYDVLRAVSECLRPGRSPLPEHDRLSLIALFAATVDARSVLRTFRNESDRLAAALAPGRQTQHPVAQRARTFIDGHAGERVSLARVARELGVTRTYLSALFRRECGVTLTEYIHHVRIERAEALLRQGGHSMASVATLSGYGSYRHFHRSFLKLRQVSPRAYARTLGAGRRAGGWPIGPGGVPGEVTDAGQLERVAAPPGVLVD